MNTFPFKFEPYLKSVIWGGEKIARFKGITTAQTSIGESWELSGVPGHESVCAERGIPDDPNLGLTLPALIEKYGATLVGAENFAHFGTEFPLLVKFIDSRQDLSIQVHPNDELAVKRHHCAGKTEMWYVINTESGARIYTGLKKPITPDDYERLAHTEVREGENPFADVIASYESHAGDVFFLPAGRIHAIGAGNLLAEIQQTSDITYRVCDYGRRDAEGRTRQLHVEEAKQAIDYQVHPDYRTSYDQSQPSVELVSCPYFTVRRERIDGQAHLDYHCDSFVIVVCLSGEVIVNGIKASQGETLLVPACANALDVHGHATLLTAFTM
ncbi:MAG: class I mannose-6-phosphate isomerase [Bacteroidaceae bacterium]|nr:class I mannose-6-phosphate isomerase [Bacteroidaceae bacterium]